MLKCKSKQKIKIKSKKQIVLHNKSIQLQKEFLNAQKNNSNR